MFVLRFLFACGVVAGAASSATASIHFRFDWEVGSSKPISGNNDFRMPLAAALGTLPEKIIVVNGDVRFSANGVVEFYAHASESSFNNRFELLGPVLTGGDFTESNDFRPWQDPTVPFATIAVNADDRLSELVQFATDGQGVAPDAQPGDDEFGILLPQNPGDAAAITQVYFAYDDNGAGPDDDYDDLIVSAVFRPLPVSGILQTPEPRSIAIWSVLAFVALAPGLRRFRHRFS
jgi:hypothetical protein